MALVVVFAHEKRRLGEGMGRIMIEHHVCANDRRLAYMWAMKVPLNLAQNDSISEYLDVLRERAREFGRSRTV